MTDLISKENLSSIATWGAIILTPIFTYFGIQVDEGTLIAGLSAFVTLVIALYSSKNPNTLEVFDNDIPEVVAEFDADNAEESIADLIEKYNANSTVEVEEDGI